MKLLISLTLAAIAALSWTFALRLGVFKSVAISVAEDGPLRMVYKPHLGAYHKIVPIIEEVEKWAQSNGETCKLSFGEYLDDPSVTDEDRRHANGGCIVEKDWSGTKLPDGYLFREIPRRSYLIAKFDGAPSIGPFKVYPKATSEMAERHLQQDGATIEMYELEANQGVTTYYHFPVKPLAATADARH